MAAYLLRRIGFLALTVLLTSIIIFALTLWLPGDVARIILGREAGEEQLAELREELGLDQPVPIRYLSWLEGMVRGDWGSSYSTRANIRPLVLLRLRNSLMLAAVTLAIAVPAGVLLGVLAGLKQGSVLDTVISIASLAVVGLPEFVTGLVLVQVVALEWRILPANSSIRPDAGFVEALPMLILPAVTATLVLLAYIARLTRAGVADELGRPYVRTATLKGIPYHRVILVHVLRNALLPTITVVAISFGWLISGLVVVENVFNYPGLGRLLVFAIDRRDLPLMQAITMVAVIGFASANLLADLAYAALNPRIRLGA
ncbi:MAG: ABC transporter permease [Anaerolineae bacterium]